MQKSKVRKLKKILQRSETEKPEDIKEEAKDFLQSVDTNELIEAEQEMIEEGVDPAALGHLCAAHLEVMADDLDKMKAEIPDNHPIAVLVAEHDEILKFLAELEQLNQKIALAKSAEQLPKKFFGQLEHLAHHLVAAEKHHQREEEILFPQLEKYGVYGPPQIMAMEHTTLRALKRELNEMTENEMVKNFNQFKSKFSSLAGELVQNLRDHIFKENNILYPAALKVIPKAKWRKIGVDADKIGYCCFTPPYLRP